MSRTIVIEPVTRIEGHAKVVVHLNDDESVARADLHVNEFRGFEKFCEGRMFFEMPQITARICGICPVSHHLASVKACDALLGVEIPPAAALLRELLHMGQTIQSHAMHFFELAGPDLLLGFDADPALRNVVGLYQANPELAGKAIALRAFGQSIIGRLGERRIHPNFAVPGGVNKSLEPSDRAALLADIPRMIDYVQDGLAIMKGWAQDHQQEMAAFASFPTAYLGMVSPHLALELYDGPIRLVDAQRQQMDLFPGSAYLDKIAEHVEPWSYLKFPYYRPGGWPDGIYRVGPLARLNAATHIAAPLAQAEYAAFTQLGGAQVVQGTLYYHYARLIENLYAVERARQLLEDPRIISHDIMCEGTITHAEGVGVLEAPRGTLIHHYWVDETGRITKVNLIVATGHNNAAMCRAVDSVAKAYVKGPDVSEGALNRIEAAIRAYDPCLSCSTHALGQMPLAVDFVDARGTFIRQVTRG